jgi:hypothetical protein
LLANKDTVKAFRILLVSLSLAFVASASAQEAGRAWESREPVPEPEPVATAVPTDAKARVDAGADDVSCGNVESSPTHQVLQPIDVRCRYASKTFETN